MVADLLRAGPAATRDALREDGTLASFLEPGDFARLAEYATPRPPPAAKAKPGADVLKAMNSRPQRTVMAGGRLFISITLGMAIAWLTIKGVIHLAR